MDYEEFIDTVASRVGVTADQATTLTRATLETLAERLSGGEARDLASQLPRGLQECLRKPREAAERFELPEFIRRVSARAGVDIALASDGAQAVLTTVRDAVTAGEFEDVMSQLPKEFGEIVQPLGARVGVPRGRR